MVHFFTFRYIYSAKTTPYKMVKNPASAMLVRCDYQQRGACAACEWWEVRGRQVAIRPELAADTAIRQLAGDVIPGRVSQPFVASSKFSVPHPLVPFMCIIFCECVRLVADRPAALTLTCSKVNTCPRRTSGRAAPLHVVLRARALFRTRNHI